MSYRAGTRGMAALGIPDADARVTCDDCGEVLPVGPFRRGPPLWLLDGRAPPKWRGGRRPDGTRWDRCPRCAG